MSNNVDITAGAGVTVGADDCAGVQIQLVKLVSSTEDSTTRTGVAADPLQVSIANTGANATPVAVSVATIPSHAVTNAGTFAVQPGAATSGGCSTFHLVAAGSDNAGSIKASAGQVYGISVFNKAAYPIYVKLHNDAGVPTAGVGVVRAVGVQAGLSRDLDIPVGLTFATGIALTIVKDLADAGTTAVVAADCVVDIAYK